MTGRERVARAIGFRGPDRVPVVFWNRDPEPGGMMCDRVRLGARGATP